MRFFVKHKKLKIIALVLTGLLIAFLCIPVPKFDKPYSTVLTAKDGELLGAKIADDGQWRFPATNDYSPKYVACLLEYEDRWFFFHPGFNPVSFVKSFIDNVKAGEVVRGGSTLSMQVVRMSRDNPRSCGRSSSPCVSNCVIPNAPSSTFTPPMRLLVAM